MGSLKVAGDGGEEDLQAGIGEASPSHLARVTGTFAGYEKLLDAVPYIVDGTAVLGQSTLRPFL